MIIFEQRDAEILPLPVRAAVTIVINAADNKRFLSLFDKITEPHRRVARFKNKRQKRGTEKMLKLVPGRLQPEYPDTVLPEDYLNDV